MRIINKGINFLMVNRQPPELPKGFTLGRISDATQLAIATNGENKFLVGMKPPRLFPITAITSKWIAIDFENAIPL